MIVATVAALAVVVVAIVDDKTCSAQIDGRVSTVACKGSLAVWVELLLMFMTCEVGLDKQTPIVYKNKHVKDTGRGQE